MENRDILACFDEGFTLNRCIEMALAAPGQSSVAAAVHLVRAAMEMPDQSGAGIKTVVHSTDDVGLLHVGGGYIEILEHPASDRVALVDKTDKSLHIVLTLNEPSDSSRVNNIASFVDGSVASFVSMSVTLRAACINSVVRQWLTQALGA